MANSAAPGFYEQIKSTFTIFHTLSWMILLFLFLYPGPIWVEYGIFIDNTIFYNNSNAVLENIWQYEFWKSYIGYFGIEIAFTLMICIGYFLVSTNIGRNEQIFTQKLEDNGLVLPGKNNFNYVTYFSYLLMTSLFLFYIYIPFGDFFYFSLFLLAILANYKTLNSYNSQNLHGQAWIIGGSLYTMIVVYIVSSDVNFSGFLTLYQIYLGLISGYWINEISKEIFHWNDKLGDRNELDYCDAKIVSLMVTDPNWSQRTEFSSITRKQIFASIEKFDKFLHGQIGYESGKWIAKIVDSKYSDESSESELIEVILRNTKNRMIYENMKKLVMLIFPPGYLLYSLMNLHSESQSQVRSAGEENQRKLEELLDNCKRYFDVKYDSDGAVSSISSKYYGPFGEEKSHVLPKLKLKRFPNSEQFYFDFFKLNRFYKNIHLLQTQGTWFKPGGFVEFVVSRAGYDDQYSGYLANKKAIWLNEETYFTSETESIDPVSNIYPQFARTSVESIISPEFEEWLRKSHVKRDCNLTLRFLQGLPKSELHAHIGGILDVESQINVGLAIWDDLTDEEKTEANDAVEPLLKLSSDATPTKSPWDSDWPKLVKGSDNDPRKRGARAAAILYHFSHDPESLQWCLFPSTENRWSKRLQMTGDYFGGVKGYAGYAVPGDLMGSTVLAFIDSDRAIIRKYAEGITKYAKEENLAYFEIRLSPTKYRTDLESQIKFIQSLGRAINGSMDKLDYEYTWRFIISADRSKFEQKDVAREFMNNFENLLHRLKGDSSTKTWIAGYDVAGKERTDDIAGELLKRFNSLNLELRLKSTFHAGEQADFNNLRSAYQIHTKRVGHALKLIDDKPLMEEFINSGICIEMCPTSNIEVHGYRVKDNPYYRQKGVLAEYPLREYLDAGVKIAICTDNPFISRTNLVNEYITASDLCLDHPLSFYEILQLSYNSLAYAFMDDVEKARIISEVGDATITHVQEIYQFNYGNDRNEQWA